MTMGAIVLSLFGAVWFEWGTAFWPGGIGTWVVLPALGVPVLLILQGLRTRRPARRTTRRRARPVFAAASAGETALLVSSLWLLSRTGHSNLAPHVAALIVALHFLPAAYFIPAHRYYATSAALVALVGLSSIMLPAQSFVICLGTASVLWGTAASMVFYRPSPPKTDRY